MAIRLWGNEALVNTTTVNGQSAPVVTTLQNGGYVIAWVDDMAAAASAVKFQRYDALGNKAGVETTVASPDGEGDQINVSICTLSNGIFVIAHEDRDPALGVNNSQIVMTRYAADGTLQGQNVNSFVAFSQPVIHESGSGFRLTMRSFLNATDTDPYTFLYDAGGIQVSDFNIDSSISLQRPTDFALGEPSVG